MRLVPEFKPSDAERWLTGQRHVGSDVQALCDAERAILSVKSVLSVSKNTIAFSPRIARITRMNRRGHKRLFRAKKKFAFSPHAGQTN